MAATTAKLSEVLRVLYDAPTNRAFDRAYEELRSLGYNSLEEAEDILAASDPAFKSKRTRRSAKPTVHNGYGCTGDNELLLTVDNDAIAAWIAVLLFLIGLIVAAIIGYVGCGICGAVILRSLNSPLPLWVVRVGGMFLFAGTLGARLLGNLADGRRREFFLFAAYWVGMTLIALLLLATTVAEGSLTKGVTLW